MAIHVLQTREITKRLLSDMLVALPEMMTMTHNLFISHKHSDTRIAKVVADFVESRTLGEVSVHMSSDPRYKGPRLGKNINQELCAALYDCNVLLLLYTSADEDWSYCMFECGVATDPQSPRTNIIVFQCGEDVPSPFADQLRVNVRDLKISGSLPRPSSPIQDSSRRKTLRSRRTSLKIDVMRQRNSCTTH